VDLAASSGIVLRLGGVLKPDALGGALGADHGEGTV